MGLPQAFLDHLRLEGYHPRSDKHSNTLAISIARDLATVCPDLGSKARLGQVVYDLNFDLHVRTATWNVDLVLGPTADIVPPELEPIRRGRPVSVEIAIEIKSVMTEHRKAVKNRKRDLEAHHEHVHQYSQDAIAGGVFVINGALNFKSPLRTSSTRHATDRRAASLLVDHCISEMRNIAERTVQTSYGLEAKCAIVVDMDNVNLADTTFIERAPAPIVGDPLNYDSFLQRLCAIYEARFPVR